MSRTIRLGAPLFTILAASFQVQAHAMQVDRATAWEGLLTATDSVTHQLLLDVPQDVATAEFVIVMLDGARQLRLQPRHVVFDRITVRFSVSFGRDLDCSVDAVPAAGYRGVCRGVNGSEWSIAFSPPVPGMLLPRHELLLARSAAPAYLAEDAGVYVLGSSDYWEAQPSRNGFSCLIQRPRPEDLWPICFNPEGTKHVLPVELFRGELAVAGVEQSAISDSIAARFRTGAFVVPSMPAIGYMLATSAWTAHPESGEPYFLPPHLHIYTPYATAPDLGLSDPSDPERRLSEFRVERPGQPDASLIIRLPGALRPERTER